MKNIIHCKANKHNDCNGLVGAELLAVPIHDSYQASDHDGDAEDGGKARDKVSSHYHENDEREDHGNADSLES